MNSIPQFTLERQTAALGAELAAAIARVLASGRFVQGPEAEALEEEIAARLGVRHAVACASGTDALHLALRAAGAGPGTAVLTTPFTFFATAGAILLAGAEVEFADIAAGGFGMDPEQVRAAVRRRRKQRLVAILPVHLYGEMAAMAPILEIGREAGVPVIEDAAQAFGAHSAAGMAGGLGLAAAFSFYPTKNLGALGEAGMLTTQDAGIAAQARELRSHGSRQRYRHERLGWNARMDELQAAILRAKLPQVAAWTERRRSIARQYETALEPMAAAGRLVLPKRSAGHVFHQYTVRVLAGRREAVRAALAAAGVGSEVYYPCAVHRQPALAGRCADQPLPEADRAAAEVLSLPMFPELTDAEVERTGQALREAVEPR